MTLFLFPDIPSVPSIGGTIQPIYHLNNTPDYPMQNGRNVAYFYNEEVGKFYYYKDHPMKPRRIAMTHSLVESFDIYKKLDVYSSRKASRD